MCVCEQCVQINVLNLYELECFILRCTVLNLFRLHNVILSQVLSCLDCIMTVFWTVFSLAEL
jgi:hypothetical protein